MEDSKKEEHLKKVILEAVTAINKIFEDNKKNESQKLDDNTTEDEITRTNGNTSPLKNQE